MQHASHQANSLARKLTLFSASLLLSIPALHAQATRTWVSGVGDDANPCSRTAPCKTWAGAISKTAPGGEMDALDPGGFGALTITKSITIDGGGGQVASVLVAGTNGIVIAAAPGDVVTLRNLMFDGLLGNGNANAGINGIRFISGSVLHIQHCEIFGFSNDGIDVELTPTGPSNGLGPQVSIVNSDITDNGQAGLYVKGTSTPYIRVMVWNSHFNNDNIGIEAADYARIAVADSEASGNNTGFLASTTTGPAQLNIANSTAANNGTAGVSASSTGSTANVRVENVAVFNNGTGFQAGTGGTIQSFGNNYNTGSGTPNGTAIPPQ